MGTCLAAQREKEALQLNERQHEEKERNSMEHEDRDSIRMEIELVNEKDPGAIVVHYYTVEAEDIHPGTAPPPTPVMRQEQKDRALDGAEPGVDYDEQALRILQHPLYGFYTITHPAPSLPESEGYESVFLPKKGPTRLAMCSKLSGPQQQYLDFLTEQHLPEYYSKVAKANTESEMMQHRPYPVFLYKVSAQTIQEEMRCIEPDGELELLLPIWSPHFQAYRRRDIVDYKQHSYLPEACPECLDYNKEDPAAVCDITDGLKGWPHADAYRPSPRRMFVDIRHLLKVRQILGGHAHLHNQAVSFTRRPGKALDICAGIRNGVRWPWHPVTSMGWQLHMMILPPHSARHDSLESLGGCGWFYSSKLWSSSERCARGMNGYLRPQLTSSGYGYAETCILRSALATAPTVTIPMENIPDDIFKWDPVSQGVWAEQTAMELLGLPVAQHDFGPAWRKEPNDWNYDPDKDYTVSVSKPQDHYMRIGSLQPPGWKVSI